MSVKFYRFLTITLVIGFLLVDVFACWPISSAANSNVTCDVNIVPGKVIVCLNNPFYGDLQSLFPDIEISDYKDVYLSVVNVSKQSRETMDKGVLDGIGTLYEIELSENTIEAALCSVEKLNGNEKVKYAELDHYVYGDSIYPNDPLYSSNYHTPQWGMNMIDAPYAWDYITESNVEVAVIDTGIENNHEDLSNNIDDSIAYNAYEEELGNTDDICGHGTSVAGVIGAEGNNSIGVAGVCWKVKMIPIKISTGTEALSTMIVMTRAIIYATNEHVKVSNLSFSIDNSQSFLNAVAAYTNSGGIFVKSAGNDAECLDDNPTYVSLHDMDGVIVVGSSHYGGYPDYPSSSSNYGSTVVDLFAPGNDINTTFIGNTYACQNGSSLAAPFVAGAAALIKTAKPNLTNAQVKSVIVNNAEYSGNLTGFCASSGRLDLYYSIISLGHHIKSSGLVANGVILPHQVFADYGDVVSVTVVPNQGYQMLGGSLEFNNIQTTMIYKNNYYFIMPNADVVLSAEFYMVGDVDLDGAVTIADSLAISRYSSGMANLSGNQLIAADVDGDGDVDDTDATLVMRYLVGMITVFPIEV